MIRGLGNDIVEISRIQVAIERRGQRFLDLMFTPEEKAYCLSHRNPYPHFAGRFAAKEAVVKSLGTGLRDCSWLDIGIVNDDLGRPTVVLSEEFSSFWNQPSFLISISHCREYAMATAILL